MACKGGKKGPKGRVMAVLLFTVSALCIDAGAAISGPSGVFASDQMTIRLDTIVSTRYTECVPLAGSFSWGLLTMANDTSAAGFASDSINFRVGYRTVTITINALGRPDTIFCPNVIIDTLTLSRADTTSITGYMVKKLLFTPSFSEQFIQFFVTTVAGQKTAAPQKAVLAIQRIYGTFVRNR